ncbi:hypothetical protein GJ496_011808 [Pomphorhynchus laevis]|nr:hypothetical protein GJ496_011808 [Pomphorhynchus laevis]
MNQALEFDILCALKKHADDVKAVLYIQQKGIISCSRDGQIILWELDYKDALYPSITGCESVKDIQLYHIKNVFLNCLANVSINNNLPVLLCGGSDCNIRSIDLSNNNVELFAKAHSNNVCSLTVNPVDSNEFISTSWDNTCLIWSFKEKKALFTIATKDTPIWCCAYSPDAEWLLLGSADKSIDCCKRKKSLLILQFTHYNAHEDCVRAITFLDNDVFVSASNDGNLITWRLSKQTNDIVRLRVFTQHTNMIFTMAYAFERLATAGEDMSVKIWSYDGNDKLKVLKLLDTVQLPVETCWNVCWINKDTFAASLRLEILIDRNKIF